MTAKIYYCLSIGLILFAAPAFADITKCNGIWTNQPCESTPSEKFDEKNYVPPTADEQEKIQKRSLYSKFDLQRIRAEGQFGITLSVAEVESVCAIGTLKECQDAVGAAEKHLNEQVVKASALKEKTKDESKQGEQPPPQVPNVTIIDNSATYIKPRRHHYRSDSGSSFSAGVSFGGPDTSIKAGINTEHRHNDYTDTRRKEEVKKDYKSSERNDVNKKSAGASSIILGPSKPKDSRNSQGATP